MLGVLALALWAIVYAVMQLSQRQLQTLVAVADRRLRHDPCRVQGRFGVIEALSLAGDPARPRIDLRCRTIAADGYGSQAEELVISLGPPRARQQLRTAAGLDDWLGRGGITRLEELSVEARATAAAMECLRERQWIEEALIRLETIRGALTDTLAKAESNELLEASIPQLQQARHSAAEMLRKLHDFLSVPDGIRPILSFDLDQQLFDPQRFADLERSFDEVVLLNDSFRQLSRDAIR